jgi:hypothetical protein
MNNSAALYEINTRIWFSKFDKHNVKNLSEVPDGYWQRLKSLGIDYVWLMGIWKTNESVIDKYCFEEGLVRSYNHALKHWSREDVIGSPYSIDAYEMNPHLGSNKNLLDLKAKLNKIGIKLILDFISNHYSAHSSLIKTHPKIFLQADEESYSIDPHTYFKPFEDCKNYFAHGRDPFFPAWGDTIQLNCFAEESREFSKNVLSNLTQLCDGVRCDMAMLSINNVFKNTWVGIINRNHIEIPKTEYWEEVIGHTKKIRPDFVFIAEAYWDLEYNLQQLGFDYTYDKKLTDRLKFAPVSEIISHLNAEKSFQQKTLRFLENHDEERIVTAIGVEKSKAAAVVISTIQGLRFFHEGQFEGRKIKLPLQLGREPVESEIPHLNEFYEKLLKITSLDVIRKGEWSLQEAIASWPANETFKNFLAWKWELGDEKILVVINYSNVSSACRIVLDFEGYPEEFVITDLLNDVNYHQNGEEVSRYGLYVDLKPWQAHIFSY